MVLVAANLAVFAAILAVIYRLCRRAWGAVAAALAGIAFVAVFGFSQYVKVANYNYVTPYAHQTTHGMLVCLLLLAGLVRWLDDATPRRSLLVGLLLGLTAVLKPEFMLAGGLVTIAAGLIRWRHRGGLSARAHRSGDRRRGLADVALHRLFRRTPALEGSRGLGVPELVQSDNQFVKRKDATRISRP